MHRLFVVNVASTMCCNTQGIGKKLGGSRKGLVGHLVVDGEFEHTLMHGDQSWVYY